MTKRVASMKAIKTKKSDLPPIEETFEQLKQGFINTVEVSIQLAMRIDNLMNIRDYAYKFWGNRLDEKFLPDERLEYLKDLQELSIECYRQILDAVMEFELEEFTKDDMKDYFEDLMPNVGAILNEEQLCEAGLIFLTVKPYGEKMSAMHHTILDEKKQREFEE